MSCMQNFCALGSVSFTKVDATFRVACDAPWKDVLCVPVCIVPKQKLWGMDTDSEQYLLTDLLEVYLDGLNLGDYMPNEASDSNA